MRDSSLSRAIDIAAGVAQLAWKIGIAQPSVSNWRRIPVQHVMAVELRPAFRAGSFARIFTRERAIPSRPIMRRRCVKSSLASPSFEASQGQQTSNRGIQIRQLTNMDWSRRDAMKDEQKTTVGRRDFLRKVGIGTIGAGAISPPIYGVIGDMVGPSTALVIVAAVVLVTLPLTLALRPALKIARIA